MRYVNVNGIKYHFLRQQCVIYPFQFYSLIYSPTMKMCNDDFLEIYVNTILEVYSIEIEGTLKIRCVP